MSILDALPGSSHDFAAAFARVAPQIEAWRRSLALTPRQRSVLDAVSAGAPLGVALEITARQRDALFRRACALFKLGDHRRARGFLILLTLLQPLDARAFYALALTYQAQGDAASAARFLVRFLALDATNPDGYLRLGECFLSARDYGQAQASFRTALRLCERGCGVAASRAYARRMLDYLARAPVQGRAPASVAASS